MDKQSFGDDEVRAEIHRALQNVKAGDAFMTGDLREADYERIPRDKEMLDKFFTYVSKSMTESWTPKKRKKGEKQILEVLQLKRDMWVQEIRDFNRDPSRNEAKNEAEMSTQPQNMEETRVVPDQSKKRNADDELSNEKPKAKKQRRDSSTKKKSPKKRMAASKQEPKNTREAAKKEFETEKARILGEVPDEYKAKWGKVGFGLWGKEWLPCLILGPFHVGPKTSVRETWMKMFENTKKRRDSMTFLAYWYGSVDLDQAYTFLTAKKFQEYDEKLDKLPSKLQKKIDSEKELSKHEDFLRRGLEEMRQDLQVTLEERLKTEFLELHEETDESEPNSDSSVEEDLEKEDHKPSGAKKTTKLSKKAATDDDVDEMDFAEDEVSADDSKDEETQPSSSEDEDDDVDFSEKKAKSKPSPKKEKKKIGKPEIQRRRSKPKKDATGEKEPKKEVTEDTKKKKERKTFKENEELFLPMLNELKAAIKSKDTGVISRVVREMLDDVNSMGAPFIEAYEVSPLLKTAKGILKEKGVDTSTYTQLWTKLGNLYATKKVHVPTGYMPQKREAKAPKSDRKSGHGVIQPEKEAKIKEDPDPTSLERRAVPLPVKKREPSLDVSVASPKREVEASSQVSKMTSQKSEKKSFSLNKLLSNPDPSGSRMKTEEGARSGKKSSQKESIKILPLWITSAPSDLGQFSSEEEDRMLALEFLEGAASRFPAEEVNRESVARGLENAIYLWSQEQNKKEKEDTYWNKVHAVVAGICGKTKPGTLVAAIMAGEYASAKDVVALSDDVFLRSFEG